MKCTGGKQLPDGIQSSQHSLILHYSLLLSPPPFHTLLPSPSNYAQKPRNSTRCVSKAVLPVSGQGGGSQGTETQWRGCAGFPDPSLISSCPSPSAWFREDGEAVPKGDKPGCTGTGVAMTPPISRQLMPQENPLGLRPPQLQGECESVSCWLLLPPTPGDRHRHRIFQTYFHHMFSS